MALAAPRGPSSNGVENNDIVSVQYSLDNGPFVTIGRFMGDESQGAGAGGNWRQDANLNNSASDDRTAATPSPVLTAALQNFTFNVGATGGSLRVQVVVDTRNSTAEEIVFDNIRVTGTGSSVTPPALAAIETAAINYNEGAPAVQVTNSLTVAYPGGTNLTGATVQITNYVAGEDELTFTPAGNVTGSFAGGTLALSGTAAPGVYQTVLRSVRYRNADATAATRGTRVISFSVRDGSNLSNGQSRNIVVSSFLNDVAALPYTEDFETDGEGTRYESGTFVVSGNLGFFRTATQPPFNGTNSTFSNVNGSGYWYGEGTNSLSNATVPTSTVQLAPVDATGYSDLRFTLRLGRGQGAGADGWEAIDYVRFYYRANNGTWTLFGAFYGITASGELRRDADLNGVADPTGQLLTSALQDVVFTGSSVLPNSAAVANLEFKIELRNDATEELAFDYIRIAGVTLPTVTTAAASAITAGGATLGGNVTSEGGGTVTERGVVYLPGNGTPTTSNTKVAIGSGPGAFSQAVTGLAAGTTYSVRAYATNSAGTGYGSVVAFSTATTVSSIVRTGASPTSAASVGYTVTFAHGVSGLTTGNFTLTTSGGLAGASISSVAGSGTTYTVTVNTGTGSGTLRLDLATASGLTPGVANAPFTTGEVYTLDRTGPAVTSVGVPPSGTYKAGDVLSFTVNFNEAVVVTGTPQLSLVVGATTRQASYAAGSGSSALVFGYTVQSGEQDANGITLGSLALNGGTLRDALNNNATLTLNNVASTAGVLVDAVAPTVVVSSSAGSSGSSTSASPIPFTVTFSEPVTGFSVADLTVGNGTASGFGGSGTMYSFSVTPTAAGTVTVNVPANGAQDAAGNGNTAATQFSLTYQPVTAAPVVLTPANNSSVPTNTPTYTGTAPAGSTVTVYVDFTNRGTTTADGSGNWSFTQLTALTTGSHTVYATAQLSGFALSANSNTNTFTVLDAATYGGSTAEQASTRGLPPGSTNQAILRVAVTVGGGPANPLVVQSLGFTTTGSQNPGTNLAAARVYYTGTSAAFGTATPFGSTVGSPNGAFSVTGTQQLQTGVNYFWLVYDVAPGAQLGNVLDATVSTLRLSGTDYVPSNPNPTGSRRIIGPARQAGQALRLAGTTGLVDFGTTNSNLVLGPQYTQEVWIRPNNGGGSAVYGVLGYQPGADATRSPYIAVTGNGRIEAGFGTGTALRRIETSPSTITDNAWSHVAVTYTGTVLTIYLNGVSVQTGNFTDTPVATPVRYVGTFSGAAPFYTGDIDEVAQWNRALTQQDVRRRRHLVLNGDEADLTSYIQFNEASGPAADLISDASGTLSGSAARAASTAAVGYGVSNLQTVSTGNASPVFAGTNVDISFSGVTGSFDVVVARLEGRPSGTQPSLARTFNAAYWIINQYPGGSFSSPAAVRYTLTPRDISPDDAANAAAQLRLLKRPSNSDGAFESPISATSASAAAGTVTFPVTSFSQTVIGTLGTSPLPVELVRFTAERRGADAWLRWTTAQETNNAYFEVQASVDGQAFRPLGRVAGHGTSAVSHEYQFVDQNLARYHHAVVYYRLRQVDLDGSQHESDIVTLAVPAAGLTAEVFPNPATEQLTVRLGGRSNGLVGARLYDAQGRQVLDFSQQRTATSGSDLRASVGHLPAGVYTLRLQLPDRVLHRSVVISH
ncbi:LamG-like jellyroll fold domain-containing protein [Hymenobacter coalescens]